LNWVRDFGLKEGKLTEEDLKRLHLTDSPAEVVKIIVDSQSSFLDPANNVADEYQYRDQ
jgi:hypothetical protein